MKNKIFLDGVCPVCGRHCGNGGHGMTLRCPCGWTGEFSGKDQEILMEFIRCSQERERKAENAT